MTIWDRPRAQRVRVQRELGRLVLRVRPDGLQARARRNAWAAMVADHQRRLDRVAADAAAVSPKPSLRARA